jgi:hypothetical protein
MGGAGRKVLTVTGRRTRQASGWHGDGSLQPDKALGAGWNGASP